MWQLCAPVASSLVEDSEAWFAPWNSQDARAEWRAKQMLDKLAQKERDDKTRRSCALHPLGSAGVTSPLDDLHFRFQRLR
jgi:hypothetical protein